MALHVLADSNTQETHKFPCFNCSPHICFLVTMQFGVLEFWSDGVLSRELFASEQKDRKRLPSTHIFPSKHLLSVFYLPQEFDAKHEIKQVEQFFTSVFKKDSILRRG